MKRVAPSVIESLIVTVRGEKVILDAELAQIYGVTTKRLNEQIKRNHARFPEDFVFELTQAEIEEVRALRSQIATLKRGQHRKYLPFAFTEHGAIMAAMVLNSPAAVTMSVYVIRAFVHMRAALTSTAEFAKRLAEIETILLSHDGALRDIIAKIQPLLQPPPDRPRKEIGFHIRERASDGYRVRKKA